MQTCSDHACKSRPTRMCTRTARPTWIWTHAQHIPHACTCTSTHQAHHLKHKCRPLQMCWIGGQTYMVHCHVVPNMLGVRQAERMSAVCSQCLGLSQQPPRMDSSSPPCRGTCSTPQGVTSCVPHQSTHPSLLPVTLRSTQAAQRVHAHGHATRMHMLPLCRLPCLLHGISRNLRDVIMHMR
jgi:hypothetical protein